MLRDERTPASTAPAEGNTTAIIATLGAVGGASLTAYAAYKIFERISGSRYSQADKALLITLKTVYRDNLLDDPPIVWALDSDDKPIFRILGDWSGYVRDLDKENSATGNFHRQSRLIAQHVSTYLSARRKRFFVSGKPGDPLEQFLSEWINFALMELSKYTYNEASIKKIEQRIEYLVAVRNHSDLFRHGYNRKHNKFDVIESIRQELLECVGLAKKEALRACARDKFNSCRASLADLLHSCANSIYCSRGSIVYDVPFKPRSVIDSSSFLSTYAAESYAALRSTHTGLMLSEQIKLSRLASFGAMSTDGTRSAESMKPGEAVYFTENLSPKAVDWSTRELDLPPWVDKAQAPHYLTKMQQLVESSLRVAELKRLVEEGFDLVGKLGDVWAYGDARGKLSLEGLIFLLGKELELLLERYESVYNFQNDLRQRYNLDNQVESNTPANQNFNEVDRQRKNIKKCCHNLETTLSDFKAKLSEFSQKEVNQIDAQKEAFYQSLVKHVKQYYPDDYFRYKLLVQPLTQEENSATFDLESPLLDATSFTALSSSGLLDSCFPGEKFSQWKKEYFNRHKQEYLKLARMLGQFQTDLNQKAALSDLTRHAREIRAQLELMRAAAQSERPAWRLGWFFLTLGWPFKQGHRKNLELLLEEMEFIEDDVQRWVEEEARKRGELEVVSLALLRKPRVEKTRVYVKNKSTIFTLRPVKAEKVEEEKKEHQLWRLQRV